MKKKILFAISIATLLIASCKKDNAGSQIAQYELKFSTEALAYVQLPLYKYFIYKDSATASLDSVIVTQSNLERIFVPTPYCTLLCPPAYFYQRFTLTLTKYNGATPQDWFYGIANNSHFWVTNSDAATALYLVEKDQGGHVFDYPIFVSSNSYGGVTIIPSIIIESKTYLNAVVFTSSTSLDTSQSYYRKISHYWVKGIGIIKREIRTSNTVKTDLLVRNG